MIFFQQKVFLFSIISKFKLKVNKNIQNNKLVHYQVTLVAITLNKEFGHQG